MPSRWLNSCSGCCQILTGNSPKSQAADQASVFKCGFLYQDPGACRDTVKQFYDLGIAHLHTAM